jgi:uncharacterized iron-regulated membrane protein
VILWFVAHPWALLLIIVAVVVGAYTWIRRERRILRSKKADRSSTV